MSWKRGSRFFSRPLFFYLFFPASILYMELVVKIYCFGPVFDTGLFHAILFTIPLGLFFALLCSLFPPKVSRILSVLVLVFLTIAYYVQAVYYTIFKTFLVLYSVTATGETAGKITETERGKPWRAYGKACPSFCFCFSR